MFWNLFALVFGYVTAKVFAGPHEHQRGVFRSLILRYHKLKIHLHHWIMGMLAISFLSAFKLFVQRTELIELDILFIWFMTGIVFQGIHDYTDWKEIVVR